jgi:hypothetical protein
VLIEDVALGKTVVLVDTNVIIEAVRTGTWNALTGALIVETVKECEEEALRGDAGMSGYVPVTPADLMRMKQIHVVSEVERAAYFLADPDAVGLDKGEQDLFAHAWSRAQAGDLVWILCTADKAAIRAAVRIRLEDSLFALEQVCGEIGARPRGSFRSQHEASFLSRHRTEYKLAR